MPAPPATPSPVVRLRFMHNLTDPLRYGCAITLGYTGGPASTGDLNDAADNALATYASTMADLLSSAYHLAQVQALDLSQPSLPIGMSTGAAVAGTRSGVELLANTAVTTVYEVARRYRGSRPKTFWPFGVGADLTTNQQWNATFCNDVASSLLDFVSTLGATASGAITTGSLVGISYFEPPYHVVTSPTTGRARNVPTSRTVPLVQEVTNVIAASRVASQRRRLGGR